MQALTEDASAALVRALRARFVGLADFFLEEMRSRSWASATFAGARHELAFRLEGAGAEAAAADFLATLEAAEFDLRGHVLADIALVSEERSAGRATIRLEALTVEDS
jgi:hypothetical protein